MKRKPLSDLPEHTERLYLRRLEEFRRMRHEEVRRETERARADQLAMAEEMARTPKPPHRRHLRLVPPTERQRHG